MLTLGDGELFFFLESHSVIRTFRGILLSEHAAGDGTLGHPSHLRLLNRLADLYWLGVLV